MKLKEATRLAERIRSELLQFCDKLEIAGSIRRQRPEVGDIDLVCLPKPGQVGALRVRCLESSPKILTDGDQILRFELRKVQIQVDLYLAKPASLDMFDTTPGNFGMRLLAMTGSKEHNIVLCKVAKSRGLHFSPYRGIFKPANVTEAECDPNTWTQCVASESEADIFKALDLEFITPEKREANP